jgi:hypothetical protein
MYYLNLETGLILLTVIFCSIIIIDILINAFIKY